MTLSVVGCSAGVEDQVITIPKGTGDQLDAGNSVDIIGEELTIKAGDTLTIINNDDTSHSVGPFEVAAGEVLTYDATTPGTIEGYCSIHPSGRFVLTVTPA